MEYGIRLLEVCVLMNLHVEATSRNEGNGRFDSELTERGDKLPARAFSRGEGDLAFA